MSSCRPFASERPMLASLRRCTRCCAATGGHCRPRRGRWGCCRGDPARPAWSGGAPRLACCGRQGRPLRMRQGWPSRGTRHHPRCPSTVSHAGCCVSTLNFGAASQEHQGCCPHYLHRLQGRGGPCTTQPGRLGAEFGVVGVPFPLS